MVFETASLFIVSFYFQQEVVMTTAARLCRYHQELKLLIEISGVLHCWWLRRPSFHPLIQAQISAAEPSGLSRWLEVRCPLSSSPGCTKTTIGPLGTNKSCDLQPSEFLHVPSRYQYPHS